MKKNHFFAFTFCVLSISLVSCDRGDILPPVCSVSANDTAVFVYQQPTPVFTSCSPGLQATVTDLNDSRCPKNAICVWQGTIWATLQMDPQFSIKLEYNKQKDTVYQGQAYSFTLVDAIPFPDINTTPAPGERKAIIRIIKR